MLRQVEMVEERDGNVMLVLPKLLILPSPLPMSFEQPENAHVDIHFLPIFLLHQKVYLIEINGLSWSQKQNVCRPSVSIVEYSSVGLRDLKS